MPGGRGDWQDDHLRTAYREARAVLEAQNETMSAIDTQAMRIVRFNVLLIGLLLTGFQVAGSGGFHPMFLVLAVGAILLSIVLGTLTFGESDLFVGPGGTYFEAVAGTKSGDREWDRQLLRMFAGMVDDNASEIGWNSWLLTASQLAMISGIACGAASILIN